MSQVYRLVYCSTNRTVGTSAQIENEIRKILAAARANNARSGLTGALMFNAGSFGQVLKGAPETVELLFERIQQDERHGGTTLLDFSPVPHRAFGKCSLAYAGSSREAATHYAAQTGEGLGPAAMSAHVLDSVLHALVVEQENNAA